MYLALQSISAANKARSDSGITIENNGLCSGNTNVATTITNIATIAIIIYSMCHY